MPTYEYQCTACAHEFEAFQLMSADPLTDCPACAKPALKRKIGRGAGFIFKGSGFYETDFKDRSGYNDTSKKDKPVSTEGAKESASTEGSKSEGAKPETAKPSTPAKPESTSTKVASSAA